MVDEADASAAGCAALGAFEAVRALAQWNVSRPYTKAQRLQQTQVREFCSSLQRGAFESGLETGVVAL